MDQDICAIEVQGLCKSYGELKAVDQVSFQVRQGEIFSLLGPNGAGKTTTISIMCGLLRQDDGDSFVMGHSISKDPNGVKRLLGFVPQEIALYGDLTARENLDFWGKMYGLYGGALKERVGEVLEVIGLTERANERIDKYSGGMKRRVNIGAALLHKPKVIFMDEPTVGIDPQSRRNILDNVLKLKEQGMTVLYTTHYMEEAQELSDRIAIMDHGRLIASGAHEELVRIVGEKDRIRLGVGTLTSPDRIEQALETLSQIPGIEQPILEDGTLSMLAQEGSQTLPTIFEALTACCLRPTSVELQEPNLESVFLHLTGRALRD